MQVLSAKEVFRRVVERLVFLLIEFISDDVIKCVFRIFIF